MKLKEKKKIAKALRTIAEKYFNDTMDYGRDRCSNPYQFGICYHLDSTELFLDRPYIDQTSDAYSVMDYIMVNMGENPNHGYFDNKGPNGNRDSWSQRAYMCLFLAEYLEETK